MWIRTKLKNDLLLLVQADAKSIEKTLLNANKIHLSLVTFWLVFGSSIRILIYGSFQTLHTPSINNKVKSWTNMRKNNLPFIFTLILQFPFANKWMEMELRSTDLMCFHSICHNFKSLLSVEYECAVLLQWLYLRFNLCVFVCECVWVVLIANARFTEEWKPIS